MSWSEVLATVPTYGGLLAAIVTAVATYFLWRVTAVLAIETRRMVDASSQPHVVATLEPSRVSMLHFDLQVANTGSGTAYDVQIEFDPPVPQAGMREERSVPLRNISVLKPGQNIASFICEFKTVKGLQFRVRTSWRRDPGKPSREVNTYSLDMSYLEGISRLGGADALTEIADQVKKIREDWQGVARGSHRIKVDGYSSMDRLHDLRQQNRWYRRARAERDVSSSVPPPNGASPPEGPSSS